MENTPTFTYRVATGSRFANPRALEAARAWARTCIDDLQTVVIVGDAPGIDAAIISEFNLHKCKRIRVHGWGGKVRCRTLYGINLALIFPSPLTRNQFMLKHYKIHDCTAFWDGASSGTRHTFTLARSLNILTTVNVFAKQKGTEHAKQ